MRLSDAAIALEAAIKFNLSIAGKGRDAQTLIPYLESNPGLGKTSIVEQVTKKLGGRVEMIRLTDYEPSDLTGWVVADDKRDRDGDLKMVKCKPDWIPDADEGLVTIFFDELPQGATSCQNAAAQVINERRVGPFELPPNAIVVAAGNGVAARAGTNHMPTHLRDRLTFFHIEPNPEDTARYFAQVGIDSRVIAYLRFKPNQVSQFDRDAQACPSPRSWERVDSWMKTGLKGPLLLQAISGQVGEAAAVDFDAYLKLVEAVPDMDLLLKNPDTTPIPTDAGVLYAVASAVSQRIDEKNADAAIRYLQRVPRKEIASFAISDAYRRNRELKHVEAVRKWFIADGKEILIGG